MFQKTQCGLWESITWMSLPFSKNQSCYKTKLAINTHDHSSWVFVFAACKYHKYYLTCFNMQNFYFLAKNKCAWGTRLWPITYHKLNSYQVSHTCIHWPYKAILFVHVNFDIGIFAGYAQGIHLFGEITVVYCGSSIYFRTYRLVSKGMENWFPPNFSRNGSVNQMLVPTLCLQHSCLSFSQLRY